MKQKELFDKPQELIKSIHEDILYIRIPRWDDQRAKALVLDIRKEDYRSARKVQDIITTDLKDFFTLYNHNCDGKEYSLNARKPPALATRRFLFENDKERCRVSLTHLVNRTWDLRGAQRRELSFLHAATPKYVGQQRFLLDFSAPWLEDPQGTITRKDKHHNKRRILVTQQASEEYRTQFLTYLLTADTINARTRTFK